MKIRQLRPSDAEDMEELSRKSWIEGYRDLLTEEEVELARESDTFSSSEEKIKDRNSAEDSIVLVAEVDDEVVGRVRIAWRRDNTHDFIDTGNEAQLRSLYVHPKYWKQGVATRLVEEALRQRPDRFKTVKVELFKQNQKGRKFYESMGFKPVDEREIGPEDIEILTERHETLIMEKEL